MRRECRERFPRHRLRRKSLVTDPSVHHRTCVTHVPWCMSGSLTRVAGKRFLALRPMENHVTCAQYTTIEFKKNQIQPFIISKSQWRNCKIDNINLKNMSKNFEDWAEPQSLWRKKCIWLTIPFLKCTVRDCLKWLWQISAISCIKINEFVS